MASSRCLAAATVISRRSLTLGWPVNSEKSDGRSVISNAASGLFSTSEICRSAIARKHGQRAPDDKAMAERRQCRLSEPAARIRCAPLQHGRAETKFCAMTLPKNGWRRPVVSAIVSAPKFMRNNNYCVSGHSSVGTAFWRHLARFASEADIKIPPLDTVKFDGLGGVSGTTLMYLGIVHLRHRRRLRPGAIQADQGPAGAREHGARSPTPSGRPARPTCSPRANSSPSSGC